MNSPRTASPCAANDNTARPAEFDRQLAAAYPRLLARARRFTPDPYSLVNETVATALHRWTTFRQTPGRPYYGFYTWLCWLMRGTANDYNARIKRRIVMVSIDAVSRPPERITNPSQEASTELGIVLSVLDDRERNIILRRVAGEQCREIGADLGISKQRVSQIEFQARAKVLAGAGLVAANDNARKVA